MARQGRRPIPLSHHAPPAPVRGPPAHDGTRSRGPRVTHAGRGEAQVTGPHLAWPACCVLEAGPGLRV